MHKNKLINYYNTINRIWICHNKRKIMAVDIYIIVVCFLFTRSLKYFETSHKIGLLNHYMLLMIIHIYCIIKYTRV